MRLRLFVLAAALAGLAGCELFHDVRQPAGVDYGGIDDISYVEHVQPLFAAKCTACHGGAEPAAGLRLDGWSDVVEGSAAGSVVVPFSPERSPLVRLVQDPDAPHPLEAGADTLSAEEAAFLARWVREGARNDAGDVPYADASSLVYVADQAAGTVSVIDAGRNVLARVVDFTEAGLGYGADPKPHHVAVEPDGSAWYVSLIGAGRIVKLDRANTVVAEAETETPGLLALHPTENLLYAGRSMTAPSPPRSLVVLDRATLTAETVPLPFPRPHALAVRGPLAYTASLAENRFAAVEGTNIYPAAVEGEMHMIVQLAVSPDGAELWATAERTGQVLVFSLANPTAPALLRALDVGARPWHPVFSPDGRRLYVPLKGDDAVAIIDVRGLAVEGRVTGDGLAEPHGSALSADGRFLYVSNNNAAGTYTSRLPGGAAVGTVAVIDTATDEIVRVIGVGAGAAGVGHGD